MYKAQVKHIEKVLFEFTSEDLTQVLYEVQSWRKDSNLAQDYDLYISDDGNSLFGSRF